MDRSGIRPELGRRATKKLQAAGRPELPWRHAEALSELLPEVILGIKPAAPCDLRYAQIARFQQSRRFAEALFLEEVAEKTAGDTMKTSGNVLPCVSELFRDRFNCDFFVLSEPPPDTLQERAK
ncbi:MAG TPA: hypothetical protein VL284_08260 [Thermoanaerobaculia bacterium]|nr:hypothetical protein [Thermoanaerobaculia bacterium]